MAVFVIRRILATIPVMLIVALFVFSLLYLAPGDPAQIIAGDRATPDQVQLIRQTLGLDQPYLVRFGGWLAGLLKGDLGRSVFNGTPVAALIWQRVEPTVSLMLLALAIAIVLGVPLGVLAAWNANSLLDRSVVGFAVMGFSIPVFVTGYILAYVFSRELQWLPVQGYRPLAGGVWPWLRHLILPAVTVSTVYIALIARVTRGAMLEVLGQDYVRTAFAKGLTRNRVLFLHALKNAAIPIVTVIGLGVALLIGGAVVTESVFVLPGLGRLTLDSILQRDYPVIQGIVLLFSVLYVMVNLMVDLLYAFLDPRIEY